VSLKVPQAALPGHTSRSGVSLSRSSGTLPWGLRGPSGTRLLKHLRQKGHAPALLEKAGLIVSGARAKDTMTVPGRIIFPIRDISGQVIAFGGRVMDDSLAKYLNSPEDAAL